MPRDWNRCRICQVFRRHSPGIHSLSSSFILVCLSVLCLLQLPIPAPKQWAASIVCALCGSACLRPARHFWKGNTWGSCCCEPCWLQIWYRACIQYTGSSEHDIKLSCKPQTFEHPRLFWLFEGTFQSFQNLCLMCRTTVTECQPLPTSHWSWEVVLCLSQNPGWTCFRMFKKNRIFSSQSR